MPAEIVEKHLVPELAQEVVTLMDDFGTQLLVQIPVTFTAEERAQEIAREKVTLDCNETRLAAYAQANQHDLSVMRSNGIAARQAKQQRNGITPGTCS